MPVDLNIMNLLYQKINYLDNIFIIIVICFIVIVSFLVLIMKWGNILDLRPRTYYSFGLIHSPNYPNNRIVNISFKRMRNNNGPFIVIYDSNQLTSARLKSLYPSRHWSLTRLEIDGVIRLCLMMSDQMFTRYNTPVQLLGKSAIFIPRPNWASKRINGLEIHSNHSPVIGAGSKIYIIGQ